MTRNFIFVISEWCSGFPFLQFKSEFCSKEFLLWATVSSSSCFCWLQSPFLAAKNLTTENQIKDLLDMAPPIRIRPRCPHSQSLPSGSFHKPLSLIHQRADRMKTTITENEPNWSHGPQPCLTRWNYEPCRVGPPKKNGWWGGEVWQNVVHWRREWQSISAFLPGESHEQYEKVKR